MSQKFKIYITVIIFLFLAPNLGLAEMKSNSYVIYENVMHSFDGPVISSVGHSVSGIVVTVSWNTNVVADGFVIYDTDSSFITSKEQGNSNKNATSHSVILTGLTANTTYYYRVRSSRVNGGLTTDMTPRSFTTGADASIPPPIPVSQAGGLLIIDKTDKTAPVITNVAIKNITDKTAEISWTTNEPATSFTEYGLLTDYGSTNGNWSSSTEHTVKIDNLEADTTYHLRALSSDGWGNVGRSEDQIIKTLTAAAAAEQAGEEPKPPVQDALALSRQRLIEFLRRIFPSLSLNQLGNDPFATINSAQDLANLLPPPILSGEPRVEVRATEATVFWTTDVGANSLVAIAPEDRYKAGTREPYIQIVGDSETMSTSHEVTVYGLTPNTTYHYQLRSKANMGPVASSRDFTFRTNNEELQITSFLPQIIDAQTAVFKWVTNKESDSAVSVAPYHGNVLAIDESKTYKDNTVAIIHEIKITDFIGGTFYNVELTSMDDKGNVATEILARFSTNEDDLPPEISRIKADSTVFLDSGNKTQTIISWLTNEPSTSRIYYQEGVQAGETTLAEETTLNNNYTKEHVMVISKFKPGIVYSFRVESIDSGGNISLSKINTFMTAKKKESILQVIMRILEDTFSWVKKLG